MYLNLEQNGSVNNILHWWHTATDEQRNNGMAWYQRESETLRAIAHDTEHSFRSVVAAAAVVSPMVNWESVKEHLTDWILYAGNMPGFRANLDKARLILETQDTDLVSGPKCTSFFMNLLQPTNPEPVTVDRHAVSVWAGLGKGNKKLSLGLYRKVAEDCRRAADIVGILPNQIQAATWVAYKETE